MNDVRMPPGRSRSFDQDEFDAELVRALQEDGRASIQELSQRLGVTREVVSHRLRWLFEHMGVKVVAALDPVFAGHRLITHARLSIDGPTEPVAEKLLELPDPVFVSKVSGPFPIVLESRHRDSTEIDDYLHRVRMIDQVQHIRLTTYSEVLKGFFVAESRGDITLDDLDHELIALLQKDGRLSFRALAEAVSLAPSTARTRVRSMVEAGVIRISAIRPGGISGNQLAVGIGVSARGDLGPIREYITGNASIAFAAASHGVYDFIATITGSSSADALQVMEGLRSLAEVSALDSWVHLDILREDYAGSSGRFSGS